MIRLPLPLALAAALEWVEGGLEVIAMTNEQVDDSISISPSQYGNEERQELVDRVRLIEVLNDGHVTLHGGHDETQPRRDAVYGTHP